jgi:hypothetical protein
MPAPIHLKNPSNRFGSPLTSNIRSLGTLWHLTSAKCLRFRRQYPSARVNDEYAPVTMENAAILLLVRILGSLITELRTLGELVDQFPHLRKPLIRGLLREGETANIIAPPKLGKSFLAIDLALAVATGSPWLGHFMCEPGKVLILDNELHPETSANRIPKVAEARGISMGSVRHRIFVLNLRGHAKCPKTRQLGDTGLEPVTSAV